MPALGAGIHAFGAEAKAWMAGPKSGHDVRGANLRWTILTTFVANQFDPNTL
jgi:hypothetical protein